MLAVQARTAGGSDTTSQPTDASPSSADWQETWRKSKQLVDSSNKVSSPQDAGEDMQGRTFVSSDEKRGDAAHKRGAKAGSISPQSRPAHGVSFATHDLPSHLLSRRKGNA